MGNEDVLETIIASGGAAPEQAGRISLLSSTFSGTASNSLRDVVGRLDVGHPLDGLPR